MNDGGFEASQDGIAGITEITEITESALADRLAEGTDKIAVLFVTALCGTCMLAERIVGLARAAGADVPLHKVNINYAPRLRDAWRIANVPCLVLIRDGQPVRHDYALHGVDYVYGLLKRFQAEDADGELFS